MFTDLYLRSVCGFALQLIPCALLLLLPFPENVFSMEKKRASILLAAAAFGFSWFYPMCVRQTSHLLENGNLNDNLYMLLAAIGVAVLFVSITHVGSLQKLFALFTVISYAATQFFLSNMLMEFLPLARQDMTYNDATLAAYVIVTAVLLPPVMLFMRRKVGKYMKTLENTKHARWEFLFLVIVLIMYLTLNVLYSALWFELRDRLHLTFIYFIPFSMFLTILLIFTFYFTIRLSIFRDRSAKQEVELALMRQNYDHIKENIRIQKQTLHDTRQLLRNITGLARDGTRENLLKYLEETMELTSVPGAGFCQNPYVNGLLVYYAGVAEKREINFSVQAVCDQVPFSDADLTILLGNALDNAIRAAEEFRDADAGSQPLIRLKADTVKDQFAIQIENSCLSVSYAPSFGQVPGTNPEGWFSADAFLSTHGGGYGLRRMEMICEKYNGYAWFSYDADSHLFTTRLMLSLNEV